MNLTKYYAQAGEQPLDYIPADGGFCGIFRSMGFIGDSLSSGEFEALNEKKDTVYLDRFEFSWGQYMARKAGFLGCNFSRGGMSASEYCEGFADSIDAWNPEKKCQAYVLALGVNDLINQGQQIGSVETDICDEDYNKNAKTFVGYYSKIIQRMKEIEPNAKFFLMSMPRDCNDDERRTNIKLDHAKVLYEIARHFTNCYVLDFNKYAPVYDEEFHRNFFLRGHLNSAGYKLTGDMTCAYIDYIVRNNPEDFRKVGLIGTNYYND